MKTPSFDLIVEEGMQKETWDQLCEIRYRSFGQELQQAYEGLGDRTNKFWGTVRNAKIPKKVHPLSSEIIDFLTNVVKKNINDIEINEDRRKKSMKSISKLFLVEFTRKKEENDYSKHRMASFPNSEFVINYYRKEYLKHMYPFDVALSGKCCEKEKGRYSFIDDLILHIKSKSITDMEELGEVLEIIYLTDSMNLLEENYDDLIDVETMDYILFKTLRDVRDKDEIYEYLIPGGLL